jgi:hypothetical protein
MFKFVTVLQFSFAVLVLDRMLCTLRAGDHSQDSLAVDEKRWSSPVNIA